MESALVMGHRYRSSALRDLLLILKVFLVSGCLGEGDLSPPLVREGVWYEVSGVRPAEFEFQLCHFIHPSWPQFLTVKCEGDTL